MKKSENYRKKIISSYIFSIKSLRKNCILRKCEKRFKRIQKNEEIQIIWQQIIFGIKIIV